MNKYTFIYEHQNMFAVMGKIAVRFNSRFDTLFDSISAPRDFIFKITILYETISDNVLESTALTLTLTLGAL